MQETFTLRITELRKERGLSQQALADAVGLSADSISMIERGKRLTSMEVLVLFANYFQVSTDYLAGLSDDPKRH